MEVGDDGSKTRRPSGYRYLILLLEKSLRYGRSIGNLVFINQRMYKK
jgi:hypothetical protein